VVLPEEEREKRKEMMMCQLEKVLGGQAGPVFTCYTKLYDVYEWVSSRWLSELVDGHEKMAFRC
jgi:hypothetical protein